MLNRSNAGQIMRYCLVGGANTAIDIAVFSVLTVSGVWYLPAQIMAYSAGTVNSFVCNRHWTFRVQGRAGLNEFGKFVFLSVLSLAVSTLMMYLLFQGLHFNLPFCKGVATAAGMAINFVGSRRWVFNKDLTMNYEVI